MKMKFDGKFDGVEIVLDEEPPEGSKVYFVRAVMSPEMKRVHELLLLGLVLLLIESEGGSQNEKILGLTLGHLKKLEELLC